MKTKAGFFCQLKGMEDKIQSQIAIESCPISYLRFWIKNHIPKAIIMTFNKKKTMGVHRWGSQPGERVREDIPKEVILKLRPAEWSSLTDRWCLASLKGHCHPSFLMVSSRWILEPRIKYVPFPKNIEPTLGIQRSGLVLGTPLRPRLLSLFGKG